MSYAISLTGKVVLVTGATSGIGEVTARVLAAMGARTVLVGRDPQKTARTAAAIQAATGSAQVDYLTADLSSQAELRALAAAFRSRYERLDVLVNNVGAWFEPRQLSVDGIEMTLALNHLSYFLLTYLLLDLLEAAKPARVINVSSESHRGARLNFNDLQNSRRYSGSRAYGQSKLANLYFTYGLAATLAASGVTANALHPGFVATPFHHGVGVPDWLSPLPSTGREALMRVVAISPEEGALTSVYLASAPEVAETTGKYFFKKQVMPSSHSSYAMDSARKLWDCSQELTGITFQR